MTVAALVEALALPSETRVDQRVPKKLLMEQGRVTAADRRRIQDGLDELRWVAALKPSNVGVPDYRDAVREYVEIAVLTMGIRPTARLARLCELVHRAIPYPVVLVAGCADEVWLTLAHKRSAQNEAGALVLDGGLVSVEFTNLRSGAINLSPRERSPAQRAGEGAPATRAASGTPHIEQSLAVLPHPDAGASDLSRGERLMDMGTHPANASTHPLDALALGAQPRTHLYALYHGWVEWAEACRAARITGRFARADTPEAAAARRDALDRHDRLQREIAGLRAQAARETQLNRRVELNLTIRRLQADLAEASANL